MEQLGYKMLYIKNVVNSEIYVISRTTHLYLISNWGKSAIYPPS